MCVTFFVYMCRLCRYLPQPSAKPSIAKVKREARGRKGSEEKRGDARESEGKRRSRAATNTTHGGVKGEKREKGRVKREEGRVKNQIATKLIY